MAEDDTIHHARAAILSHALTQLSETPVPVTRTSVFTVPDEVEMGTEDYEILAEQAVQPKWQHQTLARLFEYGIVARQRVNRSKILYAGTDRTTWFMRGFSGEDAVEAQSRFLYSMHWAVTGEGDPPPCEPKHYELDPPSGEEPPDAIGVGTATVPAAPIPDDPDDSFEMLVAQNLSTLRKSIEKLDGRIAHQQRTLDNMLSTSRKLTEVLERQQERSEAGAERTARVIEAVDRLERAAATIEAAANAAETQSLFTIATRFHAMVEEGQALQGLLFDALSRREKEQEQG